MNRNKSHHYWRKWIMVLVSSLFAFTFIFALSAKSETAYAATQWTPEAFTLSPQAKWTTGGTAGYYEGDVVPHRITANSYEYNPSDGIYIFHDYLDDKGYYGFDGVVGTIGFPDGYFFIGPSESTPNLATPDPNDFIKDINGDPITGDTPIDLIPHLYEPGPDTFTISGPFIDTTTISSESKTIRYQLIPNTLTPFLGELETLGSWSMYWEAHLSETDSQNFSFPTLTDYIDYGSGFRSGSNLHSYIDAEDSGLKTLPIGAPFHEYRSIDVCKIWIGTPGSSATINLLADGVPTGLTLTLPESDSTPWCGSFYNVPIYRKVGNQLIKIVYTISENPIIGYRTLPIEGNASTGFTVTNVEIINIPIQKVWTGGPIPTAASITATLFQNGSPIMTAELVSPNWTASFNNLDKANPSTGVPYTYTV
ncbi:MAG: Cna B-type domain-containing protein, partial [Youngiibacter sp.]|nr:Cna B-type domain-containing protein [Youngiibacter sp.]